MNFTTNIFMVMMNAAAAAATAAKSLQSCPTLCDPIDGSPPGSPVPEILQARVLEWGAMAFSDPLPQNFSNFARERKITPGLQLFFIFDIIYCDLTDSHFSQWSPVVLTDQ